MCGRFTQAYTWAEIDAFLSLTGPARNLRPRYNISPTTQIDVFRLSEGGRELVPMRWGLIPGSWRKPLADLPSTFNARAETVAEKPMFRSAFKTRRCIVPASGFFEWTGPPGAKTPHHFSSAALVGKEECFHAGPAVAGRMQRALRLGSEGALDDWDVGSRGCWRSLEALFSQERDSLLAEQPVHI